MPKKLSGLWFGFYKGAVHSGVSRAYGLEEESPAFVILASEPDIYSPSAKLVLLFKSSARFLKGS